MITSIFSLIRLKQWIKNLFLFMPLFFDLKFNDPELLKLNLIAFFSFSFLASAVYIMNDAFDLKSDRSHPEKKHRALAAGKISKAHASLLFSVLLLLFLGSGLLLNKSFLVLGFIYLLMNILYSWKLKHIPVIDVLIIAIGFVLRVFAGGVVTGIEPSAWLTVMTFLLALFIAFGKRREEVVFFEESGIKTRKVIDGYNIYFLNIAMALMASVVLVAYLMYSLTEDVIIRLHTDKLYLTSIFVITGLLRYLQLAVVKNKSGSPTELFYQDWMIQLAAAGWLLTLIILIYT
jgi:decaprenyl-phosphate phosphoribosyltransferase